jgi:hypothetical protein
VDQAEMGLRASLGCYRVLRLGAVGLPDILYDQQSPDESQDGLGRESLLVRALH